MLVEFDSDAFFHDEQRPGPLRLSEGLNTVLGTENTENSIGKSTTLLAIDFCFGGSDYVDKAKDVIKNIGHHEIRFAFLLGGETHCFRRATDTPTAITLCDKNYRPLRTMTLDDFKTFVGTQYGLQDTGISLRQAVSNFFRIWQRKNSDVDHPLLAHPRDTQADGVKRLLMLFDEYTKLQGFMTAKDETARELDLFHAAGRYYDFPRARNITEVNNNTQRIEDLQTERDQAGIRAGLTAKDYTSAQQAAINEVQAEREPLLRRFNQLGRQINAMRRAKGISSDVSLTKKFDALREFFPEANIEHIENIEHFHRSIRQVLDAEFKAETKQLEEERGRIQQRLGQLNSRLEELSVAPTATQADIRAYSELDRQIRSLANANKAFLEEQRLMASKKEAAEALARESTSILQGIEDQLNTVMQRIDGEITGEERTPPSIKIPEVGKYSYEIENDSGTGSTQRGLISFDLAMLETTLLPAVAHDSMLVQPIEDQAFDGIAKVYARQRKQIFLAIDKISRYSEETRQILTESAFVHLESGRELFGRSRSKKKKRKVADSE
ncbi:DUF2326 domain-containing protein [Trueperella pecoris]|uniref:DUF2326 domain-containing protein n=1 Tax=Trueperella pecoris TaxID=2733571 RepID=UPI00186BB0A1|nr:DUF2326 domain-containing protein [Trueperella pecoris]QOQ39372.1 DUF2326 domain-containing protein [Trueperella pecoris]